MTTTAKYVTEDELLNMPNDGHRYELIEGELRQMAPTGFEHGRCTHKLERLLGNHVTEHDLGDLVAAETGFVISRTADGRATVRAADIAFVAKGRIPEDADRSKYLELAPDLIVETISPNDTMMEVEDKIVSWLAAGVRIALTLNPASKSVTVYPSSGAIVRLTDKDELKLDDVLPGFQCRIAEIFD